MIDKRYNNVIDMSTYHWRRCVEWARLNDWPVFTFADASGQEVSVGHDKDKFDWAIWLGTASLNDLKALMKAQKAADAEEVERQIHR